VRSLEKIVKTEKSQRNSTLKQEELSAPIVVDSDQETVQVSHSSKKRKAESSPSHSGTPRSPGGTSGVKWAEQSAEHIAQKASLPVPDAKTKEAFMIFLQAMIEGLNGPSNAEMKTAKAKLERKYRKLRAAHTTATTELAEAVARVAQRGTQIGVLRTKVRTLEDQAKEGEAVAAEAQDRAQELAKTKRLNEMLTGQVKALSNRTQELQDRIQALERTDGAAQGSAESEAAKNQELEKLTAALAEKDKEIKRLKAALLAFV
jgi:DNA repair exonuclease SbcCD ATPase subunit